MLRLALAGAQSFLIDEIEIARGGVSFTWETLETLSRSHPEAELFFLAGSDSLSEFATWRRIDLIAGLATFVVLKRDGSGVEAPPELVLALKGTPLRTAVLDADPLSVSSTEIRRAVARGASLKGLVPPPVEDYIRKRGLYSPGKQPGAGRGGCIR